MPHEKKTNMFKFRRVLPHKGSHKFNIPYIVDVRKFYKANAICNNLHIIGSLL